MITGRRPRLAVVALGVALTASCSSGDSSSRAGGPSTTDLFSVTAVASASASDAGPAPSSTTVGPGGSSGATDRSTTTAAPARPAGRPAPGRYAYRLGGGGTATLDVIATAAPQEQIHALTVGDETIRQLLRYGSGGVLVLQEQRQLGADRGGLCDWSPDLLLVRLPARVGAEWSASGSCEGGDGLVTRTRTITAEVKARRRVRVGADAIDVAVIEHTIDTRTTGPGIDVAEQARGTLWWAPSASLTIRLAEDRSATAQGVPQSSSHFEMALLSLGS